MEKNNKKKYKVTITETLQKDIFIEAENETQAEKIAEDRWCSGDHILDADNFEGVNFTAEELKTPIRRQAYER